MHECIEILIDYTNASLEIGVSVEVYYRIMGSELYEWCSQINAVNGSLPVSLSF
jgi:hypothetical protein